MGEAILDTTSQMHEIFKGKKQELMIASDRLGLSGEPRG